VPAAGLWLVVGASLATAVIVMLRLSRPKFDIIETHESTVSGTAALLFMASFLIMMATGGVCLAWKSWTYRGLVGVLLIAPLSVALVFPLVVGGLAFLRLPAILRKALEGVTDPGSDMRAAAQDAGRTLGLRGIVNVRVSACKRRYHGPTVFVRWGMPVEMVLPPDLDTAFATVTYGNVETAKTLMHFICKYSPT